MKCPWSLADITERDASFQKRVDYWVRRAQPSGELIWTELLERMPGVYPTDVWASLERQGLQMPSVGPVIGQEPEDPSLLAFPDTMEHPLDYEWRFRTEAMERVMDRIQTSWTRPTCRVLCFGCPSVFVYGNKKLPDWEFVLVDRRANSLHGRGLPGRLVAKDLTVDRPTNCVGDAAIVDPPWYNPITKAFLWHALQALPVGAQLFLSMPGEGTRPSAFADMEEIIMWCRESGLALRTHERSVLPYRTPFFEINALKSSGYRRPPRSWRNGDLLHFEVMEKRIVGRPLAESNYETWTLVSVGKTNVRIRSNSNQTDADTCKIIPVWKSAVLPSVSTRFPGRMMANVVTSGNRFLHCSHPSRLIQALQGSNLNGFAEDWSEIAGVIGADAASIFRDMMEIENYEVLDFLADETHGEP